MNIEIRYHTFLTFGNFPPVHSNLNLTRFQYLKINRLILLNVICERPYCIITICITAFLCNEYQRYNKYFNQKNVVLKSFPSPFIYVLL